MRILTLILASAFVLVAPTAIAEGNAGHVFGAGITCSFENGDVKHLPRELCKAYGGQVN